MRARGDNCLCQTAVPSSVQRAGVTSAPVVAIIFISSSEQRSRLSPATMLLAPEGFLVSRAFWWRQKVREGAFLRRQAACLPRPPLSHPKTKPPPRGKSSRHCPLTLPVKLPRLLLRGLRLPCHCCSLEGCGAMGSQITDTDTGDKGRKIAEGCKTSIMNSRTSRKPLIE